MKKLNQIFLIAITVIAMSSCSITVPLQVTDNVVNEKRGEASVTVILGFIGPMDRDISIQKAAKNGGITEVGTVDYSYRIGLFKSTYTTIVTGR